MKREVNYVPLATSPRQPAPSVWSQRWRSLAACPHRKLFLFAFLWTSLCLIVYRSAGGGGVFPITTSVVSSSGGHLSLLSAHGSLKLRARSASSVKPQAVLAITDGAEQHAAAASYQYNSIEDSAEQQSSGLPAQVSSSSSSNVIATSSEKYLRVSQAPASTEGAQLVVTSVAPSVSQESISRHHEAHSSMLSSSPPTLNLAGTECTYTYPSLIDLQFNNIHWQRFHMPPPPPRTNNAKSHNISSTFYLYNAYYDDRWRAGTPSVRILAMIDRIKPPATNCLLWSSQLRHQSGAGDTHRMQPIVTRATFVYAWYPKWGNYEEGTLQPWIVTCPVPRAYVGLVPDSVSLVAVPSSDSAAWTTTNRRRRRRDIQSSSVAMPPPFSSSSSGVSMAPAADSPTTSGAAMTRPMHEQARDCGPIETTPISNLLPVFNRRPTRKQKFAVCVKGLDFPYDDVSVRLVEWIEMLHLLGASKIFLYELDVHANISKVLQYYQKRGIVELSHLTLPGEQPNLPEYQHAYLQQKLTSKRQNELIPYNDCLYRNLHSYEYLALLDIDEIIMPLGSVRSWHELMQQVELMSLRDQNYSRASYNVRNVYFFDDLSGPMGTTQATSDDDNKSPQPQPQAVSASESLERGIPHHLHMMSHVYRSKNYTEPGQYVKCFHNTERVVSLHNHFPLNCFGQCTSYSIPVDLAHLQHYRKDCVGPLRQSCKSDYRIFTTRDTTIWKYRQQMIRRTTRVLNHLGLLASTTTTTTMQNN